MLSKSFHKYDPGFHAYSLDPAQKEFKNLSGKTIKNKNQKGKEVRDPRPQGW